MRRYLTTFAFLLLMLTLLAGCSDAKEKPDAIPSAPDTTAADTAAPDTTEKTFVPIDPVVPQEPFTVASADSSLTVNAIKADAGSVNRYWEVQDTALFLLYDTVYDKDGNWTQQGENIRVAIYDAERGELVESEHLDTDMPPRSLTWQPDGEGWIFYNWNYETEKARVGQAWLVTYADGEFHIEPSPYSAELYCSSPVTSPDGKYVAYSETDPTGDGGLVIRRVSDGETTRILENVMYDETFDGIGGARGYTPIGFLPDGRLVYNIGGWEWAVGYGFYHIADGTKTEIQNGMRVSFVRDGVLYGSKTSSYAVQALCILEENGDSRTLVDEETAEHPAARAMFTEEGYYQYTKDGLLVLRMNGESDSKAYLFSHDAQTLRAELTLTEAFPLMGNFTFVMNENSLTLIY